MPFTYRSLASRLPRFSVSIPALVLSTVLLWGGLYPAIAAGAPIATAFPRLSMWWPNNDTQPVKDRARYDFIGLQNGDSHHIAELRAANPDIMVLGSNNARELNVRPDEGYNHYLNVEFRSASTDWILTQVGSKLTAAVTNSQTTIPVADATKFAAGEMALLDDELVFITSVGTSSLSVRTRGLVNPATSHTSGTRIASVLSLWPNAVEFDMTTSCPRADVGHGPETWAEWNLRRAKTVYESGDWDGLIIDCHDPSMYWWLMPYNNNRNIDQNRDNVADSIGTLDAAWNTGLTAYGNAMRGQLAGAIILANGNFQNYNLNGNIFEDVPDASISPTNWQTKINSWASPRAAYLQFLANAQQPNLSMIETYGTSTNYQLMRFGLCTALMGDGFFSYERSSSGHGTLGLYWYDEYDNAGAGRGYLGQPKGASYAAGAAYRRDYTGGTVIVNPSSSPVTVQLGATYRKIKGTQAPTVNDGSTVTAVTIPPKDGIVLLATGTGIDTIAPSVSITAPANGSVVSGMAYITGLAADNVGVTRVEFRVDGTLLGSDTTAPYAATWNASAAAPGAHTITATAYDAAGNSKAASIGVSVPAPSDTTAPSVSITSPASGATVSGSVPVAATASDNVGVTRVEFRVDGTLLGSDTTAPYAATWNASAAAPGAHTITATAYDAAGNSKAASIGVSVPAPSDTTAPSVSITSPASGATVSGSVPVAATASDNVGVTRVEFRVDGTLLGSDTTAPYAATWNASAAAPGAHTITATAYDAAGNSKAASIGVSVPAPSDTTAPSVSITSPASGATVSGSVPVAATASDNVGVTRVEFRVDGTLLGSDTTAPYAATWNASAAAPGAHTITATAYDAAGNSKAASIGVSVPSDVSPPSTEIVSPGDDTMVTGSVGIAATASDSDSGVAKVEFLVDGVLAGTDTKYPYGCTWNSRKASTGPHKIEAKAYDRAGNVAVSERTVNVASASVPAVSIISPADGATVSGPVNIQVNASDGGSGIAKVVFLVDGVEIGKDTSSPYAKEWKASGTALGTHVIEVRAYSRAGKIAATKVSVTLADGAKPAATTSAQISADAEPEPAIWTATTLSGSASQTRALARQQVRLSAKLSADGSTTPRSGPVTVWQHVGGSWSYQGEASYDSAIGAYTITVAPRATARYWFYYGGDETHQAVGSGSTTVKTYPSVGKPTVRSSSRFKAGRTLVVWGRWYRQTPYRMRVVVDRKVGGKWRRYAVKRASVQKASATKGTYAAKFAISKKGYYRVRVIPDYGPPMNAWSRPRSFRVR